MHQSQHPELSTADLAEWIKRYPDMPKRTLARFICNHFGYENDQVDNIRCAIKRLVGLSGKRDIPVKDVHGLKAYKSNFPEGVRHTFENFNISEMRLLILGDGHCPDHDKKAIETAINYGIKQGAKAILLNGDWLNNYNVSPFKKSWKNKPDLQYGVDCLEDILDWMHTSGLRLYYKLGNHCEWYEQAVNQANRDLAMLDLTDFENLLPFHKYGVTLIRDKRLVTFGKLNILHGHEFFFKPSLVNPAKWYYEKAKDNIYCSHVHKLSEYTAKDLSGKIYGGWTGGCMFQLRPEYARYNDFMHGFAYVERDAVGDFHVDNRKIIDYKIR